MQHTILFQAMSVVVCLARATAILLQVSTLFEKVCGKSVEYLHVPEKVQCMLLPVFMNKETQETILGR